MGQRCDLRCLNDLFHIEKIHSELFITYNKFYNLYLLITMFTSVSSLHCTYCFHTCHSQNFL